MVPVRVIVLARSYVEIPWCATTELETMRSPIARADDVASFLFIDSSGRDARRGSPGQIEEYPDQRQLSIPVDSMITRGRCGIDLAVEPRENILIRQRLR